VFDTMVTKLAGFPPEPVRFVGRVLPAGLCGDRSA